ncbi:MAG: hypothetical protein MR590_04835 [Clostridiales bacterium]|nr:hypothetical protein [Clostridiales bacterium]
MSRAENIAFAKDLIASYQELIAATHQQGIIDDGEYTWQEMLEENTGVQIENESDIDTLSDNDLHQIREAYI